MTKYLGLLNPFRADLSLSLPDACERTGSSYNTVRSWCTWHHIGRKIGSSWHIDAVALELFLAGDLDPLARYLNGDRSRPEIVDTFARLGVPLTPPPPSTRQRQRARRGGAHATA